MHSAVMDKRTGQMYWRSEMGDLDEINKTNRLILDVRTKDEYDIGTIDDAINISDLELRDRLNELPRDKEIYALCEVGFRGYIATRLLLQKGYIVKNLTGGYKLYHIAQASPEEIAAACGATEEIMEEMIERKSTVSDEFIERRARYPDKMRCF